MDHHERELERRRQDEAGEVASKRYDLIFWLSISWILILLVTAIFVVKMLTGVSPKVMYIVKWENETNVGYYGYTNQPGMKFGNTKQMTGTVGEIQKRVWLHFIYPVIDVIYFWIVITICLLKFRSRRETGAGTILALCFSSAFLSWSDGIFCDVTSQKLSDHYGSEHVTPGTAYQLIPHAVGVCEFFAGTCLREAFMASQKFQALRERQRRLYPADNPAQRQSWFRRRRTAQQRSDGGSRELDDLPPAEPGPFAPAAFGTNFQTWSSGSSSASSSQAGEPLDDPRLPRSLSRLAASSDHRRLSETSTAYAPSVRASSVQRSNRSISPIRPTATSLRRAQSLDLQAASQSAGRRMSQLSLR